MTVRDARDRIGGQDALARFAAIAARAAVFRFDVAQLEECAALLAEVSDREATQFARDWSLVVAGWLDVLRGESPEPHGRLCCDVAHVHGLLVRALSMDSADAADACRLARRAVRAAQSDGLHVAEREARVVLAHLLRRSGNVAQAVAVLPEAMSEWADWERVACFAPVARRSPATEATASGQLRDVLDAVRRRAPATPALCRSLAKTVASFAPVSRDLSMLRALIDTSYRGDVGNQQARDFREGRIHVVPDPLRGIFDEDPRNRAEVVIAPNWSRRVLLGEPRRRTAGRPEELICTLAFAPDRQLEDDELFNRLYGARMRTTAHRNLLDTVVYRARKLLAAQTGGRADIARRHGGCRLLTEVVLRVCDPRVEAYPTRAVLHQLAAGGCAAARDLANTLGQSPRSVQRALHDLVEQGHCAVVREGRQVKYRVRNPLESGRLSLVPDLAAGS